VIRELVLLVFDLVPEQLVLGLAREVRPRPHRNRARGGLRQAADEDRLRRHVSARKAGYDGERHEQPVLKPEHELADTRSARDALPLPEHELTKRRSARWMRPTPATARRQPLDWNLHHPRNLRWHDTTTASVCALIREGESHTLVAAPGAR